MKLELTSTPVYNSINNFSRVCSEANDNGEFHSLFESYYHCKIVADPNDPWCTKGWLEFEEEKYYTWFILQNGVENE